MPHTRSKTEPPRPEVLRVLIYVTRPAPLAWVEAELAGLDCVKQVGRSVREVVSALIDDPPPRPQLLVADFDAIDAAELVHLHSLREQGWFGSIMAIGSVTPALRTSLVIDEVFEEPFPRGALFALASALGHDKRTVRMVRLGSS